MNTPTPGASDAPPILPASPDEANRPPVSAQDWMPQAREFAAQCWCDDETRRTTMDVVLAESVAWRIASWMADAAQSQRNADYYRGLVVRCGEAFGKAAHIADDGSDMQDVLCAKVPELVEALVAERAPNPTDTHTPGSLPWEWAARELALAPASATDTIRRACEQWARSATEHWRQHSAHLHEALARSDSQCAALQEQLYLCRAVLEECRPMVKAHLLEMERFGPGDESIITRIEQARKVGL